MLTTDPPAPHLELSPTGQHPPDDAIRDRLRAAAVAYREANWPIVPTHAPYHSELLCTRTPNSPETAFEWWSQQQYGIACPIGRFVDLVQVPADIGLRMLPKLADPGLPVLQHRTVASRLMWWFLVQPGAPRIRDLPPGCPVTLINRERWISLPPTPPTIESVHWVTHTPHSELGTQLTDVPSPEVLSLRRLPHSLNVQWAAFHALTAARRRDSRDKTARADGNADLAYAPSGPGPPLLDAAPAHHRNRNRS